MDMILTNSFGQINLISYTLTLVSNSGIHGPICQVLRIASKLAPLQVSSTNT
jgi:hypothetical protein